MKNLFVSFLLIASITASCETPKYVLLKSNKYGPVHRIKAKSIKVIDGKYFYKGRELKYSK